MRQWTGAKERLPQLTRDDWRAVGVFILFCAVAWCVFCD